MKKTSKTIVFFGSGPVAAKSLRLLAADFTIEAVITKPRPEHHKGDYPVLDLTRELGLQTITVNNKTELSSVFADNHFISEIGVVIDYGIIIKPDVFNYFKYGIVNSHFSLLPEWRGADPISFSILSGQKKTGVSLILIDEGLDEGPLLAQSEWRLKPKVSTPELTDELIELSHSTLTSIIPLYIDGKVEPVDQLDSSLSDTLEPTYSRKLIKTDGILDFVKSAKQLEREVRAFLEWPRSRTTIGETDITVTKAHVTPGKGLIGGLWPVPKQLGVYTTKDVLVIDSLIPAGKKEMSAEAFLAGYLLN
jgi:methionyl-tRNA formyltransferase